MLRKIIPPLHTLVSSQSLPRILQGRTFNLIGIRHGSGIYPLRTISCGNQFSICFLPFLLSNTGKKFQGRRIVKEAHAYLFKGSNINSWVVRRWVSALDSSHNDARQAWKNLHGYRSRTSIGLQNFRPIRDPVSKLCRLFPLTFTWPDLQGFYSKAKWATSGSGNAGPFHSYEDSC